MKYKNRPIGKYKSVLEKICSEELEKAGLEYAYEPERFVILDKFNYPSWEKVSRKGKKVFIEINNVSKITYAYDFAGNYKGIDWVIETKGKRTSTFNNKWKFFKRKLKDSDKEVMLFLPSNKNEILQSIKIIKEHAEETGKKRPDRSPSKINKRQSRRRQKKV